MNQKITTSIIAKAREMKKNGKKLSEIAAELGVNKHTIQYHLKDTPSGLSKRLTDEQKEQILALSGEGLSTYKIADKLDVNSGTVYKFLQKVKEKEPATAATVTDSMDNRKTGVCDTVSIFKDNIIEPKSQALLKSIQKEFLGIYERLDESHQHVWDLGELYAQIKEAIGDEDT